MSEVMDQHRATFKQEAHEHLAELENTLLELEDHPEDQELIGRIFRTMHTIKGSGAMFGFEAIAEFCHELETVLDRVRAGEIAITTPLINLVLAARDQLLAMLAEDHEAPPDLARSMEIVAALRRLLPPDRPTAPSPPGSTAPPAVETEAEPAGPMLTYRLRLQPAATIFQTGTNPLLLLDELRALGACNVVAHIQDIPALEGLDPERCYSSWDIFLTTGRGENAIRDVFIFVEDQIDLVIDIIDEDDQSAGHDYKRIGEILVGRGAVSAAELQKILAEQQPLGEKLLDKELTTSSEIESALVEQDHVRRQRQGRQEKYGSSSIRVEADKLDRLVDLVGELVTVQARLSQMAAAADNAALEALAEEVEALTGELRDNAMSIRMLPIGSTFTKFKRLVRDLSRELGKEIVLSTAGSETELDKTVIERLNDPLVHIIRNSIDHGLETPEAREAAGKPRQGKIQLSAVHSGANVLIKVTDDGAGLDSQKIHAKALEKGLISAAAKLSEPQLQALIFAPGFSTAAKVSEVSGRGVGMDVVKRAIEALGGAVEIASTKGSGTTITLKIPLTLAIIDGLLVNIGEGAYVIPLAVVEECLELSGEAAALARSRHMIPYRNTPLSYVDLRAVFGAGGSRPAQEKVVIAGVMDCKVGFGVDQVVGQIQTVIKSLGRAYRDVEGISGATILGNGTVALIVDIPKLVQTMEHQRKQRLAEAA